MTVASVEIIKQTSLNTCIKKKEKTKENYLVPAAIKLEKTLT